MDRFATLPDEERRDILREAASRRNVSDIIMEKDFWVCWTLDKLFSLHEIAPHLTFKGGTSLSKAYGLIERFSEDIDLTISRNATFLVETKNPMEENISGKERSRRIEELKLHAQKFVAALVLPKLKETFGQHLPSENWRLELDKEDSDQQTLLFHYPRVMGYGMAVGRGRVGMGIVGEGEIGYIKPAVRLEFGARGEPHPHETRTITPYVAEIFPQFFDTPNASIPTLAAERTFWEKATILHALHHGSKLRDQMSRHYYDTYMLTQKGVAEHAMQNPALLEQVVKNKTLLFRDTKASYETAIQGSLKLLPTPEQLPTLKHDYEKMTEMFMGEYPGFDTVMEGLAALEGRINNG